MCRRLQPYDEGCSPTCRRLQPYVVEAAALRDAPGAAWLTAAMRAAGSLADSCAVRRIAELYELPLEGDDAQGGAGHKAILTVEYEGPAEALEGLHARLFVKMPWR